MIQNTREILTFPNVADGIPSAGMALALQAQRQGVEFSYVAQPISSLLASIFHRVMTESSAKAKGYTQHSESTRTGGLAKMYAALAASEAVTQGLYGANITTPQEHLLLGLSVSTVRKLGIDVLRLAVPDVFPKESGIIAVLKHKNACAFVWNRSAYEELQERGVSSELTRPYFLDGFRPNKESFMKEGVSIVVKTSGSGIPKLWRRTLSAALLQANAPWAMHTPEGRSTNFESTTAMHKPERIEEFFEDLGGQTKLLIGYPSELVSVAYELRERGVPVWLATLPPRGAHELRNLKYALAHDLVLGELGFGTTGQTSNINGLARIKPGDLSHIVHSLDNPDEIDPNELGSSPYWRAALSRLVLDP